MHNPLVFNSLENAGYNAASRVWDGAELLTHYGTPFIVYGAYKGLSMGLSVIRWAFSAPVPLAPAPEPEGWLSSILSKTLWKVVIPAGVIAAWQWFHETYLSVGFWQKYKGIGIAFLRPVMEKLMPSLYGIFDGGDWNFNLRDFVPGGEGTIITDVLAKLVYATRGGYNHFFTDCSTSSCGLESRAYALGESLANTIEFSAKLARDIIWGTSQIGPCMRSPAIASQCMQDGMTYMGTQFNEIYEAAGPLHEVIGDIKDTAYEWGVYALRGAVAVPKYMASQGLYYSDQILRHVAIEVEAEYGVPQILTYTGGAILEGLTGLFISYQAAKFAYDYVIPEAARYYARSLWESVPSLRII